MQAGERGAVKIGYVKGDERHVEERRKALQVGCPHELRTLATAPGELEIEALLHERLACWHVRGEWFQLDEDTLAAVGEMGNAYLIILIADCMLGNGGYEFHGEWPVGRRAAAA